MKKILYYLIVVFSVITTANAQIKDSWVLTKPKLVKSVSSKAEELKPILSPDEKTLYFTRVFHKDNIGGKLAGQDIWYAKKDLNGDWLKPRNKSIHGWNNKENNSLLHLSKDNRTAILLDSYHNRKQNGKGFAISELDKDSLWTRPKTIIVDRVNPKNGFFDFTINEYKNIIISSVQKNDGSEQNLLISFKNEENDSWSTAVNLSENINTNGSEISPFLVGDSVLYFSSDGHDGYGSSDIFRSKRLDDTWLNWSEPENLGEEINSKKFDAYFSITGNNAFFSSNRSSRFSSIYRSTLITGENAKKAKALALAKQAEKQKSNTAAKKEKKVLEASVNVPSKKVSRVPTNNKPKIIYKNIDKWIKGKMLDKTVIYFGFDSDALNENMKQIMTQWAYMLDDNISWRILVKGYTDNIGSETYNKALSKRRAIATQKFISEQGLKVSELIIEAKGEEGYSNKQLSEIEKIKNRRTEIFAEPIIPTKKK